MIPALIALASSLAAQGLGLIGNAVLAKGKDVVEKTLGVDIESSMGTEEGRIRLMQLQVDKEGDLHAFVLAQREQDLLADAMEQANTANARDMNARVQESALARTMAKNAAYVLDFLIVGATLVLIATLMFRAVPAENKELAFAMLGSLLTLCGTVVNFHRGSSSNNQRKDATIAAMAASAEVKP